MITCKGCGNSANRMSRSGLCRTCWVESIAPLTPLCIDCHGPVRKASSKRCMICEYEDRKTRKKRITASLIEPKLAEIKVKLVAARRQGNDTLAAELSQKKEQVKKQRQYRCLDCPVAVTRPDSRCRMHSTRFRFYKNALPLYATSTKEIPASNSDDSPATSEVQEGTMCV